MAGYNFEPAWASQVFAVVLYLASIWFMASAVLGMFRTMAVRLPLRTGKNGKAVRMFALDFWPMLRQTDGPDRKSIKCAVLALFALAGAALWTVVGTVTLDAGNKLFGWTLFNDSWVSAFHVIGTLYVLVWAAKRGWRGARKYELNSRRAS